MATDVHSVRFYNLEPNGVKCMVTDDNNRLALGRSDNSIEIWNIEHSAHIEQVILGTFGSTEGLAWFNSRLFSVGLQGSVIEYDLIDSRPKSMHPLTGGSSLCLAVRRGIAVLAAGTEDGYINLFDILDNELSYKKLLDKQEGRIICMSWATDEHLVTGSADTVRVWNTTSGHAVHRMTTGRAMNNVETMVWSLVVTSDFTIISGDSRGKLCFWDGKMGVAIATYQSHKAAVLSVCLDEDENTVYCAGIDPLIATYRRVQVRDSDEKGKWVKSIHRAIHDHEVQSLVISNRRLYSAGIDGYLAQSSYPPKFLVKYPPLLKSPSVFPAFNKTLLFAYHRELVLWSLSSAQPVKLLEWRPCNGSRIQSAALSPDGVHLAVSTPSKFSLFLLSPSSESSLCLNLNRIRVQDSFAAHLIGFSADSTTLVVAGSGGVSSVNLKSGAMTRFDEQPSLTGALCHLVISEKGKYVAAADSQRNVVVWNKTKCHVKLPRYSSSVTAMAFQPETDLLVITYSDHKIVEYSVDDMKYTAFSKHFKEKHPKQWLSRAVPVHTITFDPRNPNIIIFADDSTILVVDKEKKIPEIEAKIPRLNSGDVYGENCDGSQHLQDDSPTHAFHAIKKFKSEMNCRICRYTLYTMAIPRGLSHQAFHQFIRNIVSLDGNEWRVGGFSAVSHWFRPTLGMVSWRSDNVFCSQHLVYLGWLSKSELVAVELPPASLLDKLPSNFKSNTYGTK